MSKQHRPSEEDNAPLAQDVEQFQQDQDRVRKIIGQIGGKKSRKGGSIAQFLLIAGLVLLFGMAIFRHLTEAEWAPEPFLSLELGLLLVSVKIVWMLHKQTQVAHFQFWILNTLEMRMLDASKRLKRIEKSLEERDVSQQ